jgi:hypothetical protein
MDIYGTYDPIRKYYETEVPIGMVSVAHGMDFSIYWDIHFSRMYVHIRIMVLVSLCGVSDLFIIMLNHSGRVWLQEMMYLMLSDDTDSGDVYREFIYVIMR